MGALTVRQEKRAQEAMLPSLLDFHSPSMALAAAQPTFGARGVILVVFTMVVALAATATFLKLDRVVTATGKVVAETPTVVVQPLDTAIIRSIDVREGQVVHAGDLLARLDPTLAGADVSALQSRVSSLDAEVGRRRAAAAGEDYRPAETNKKTALEQAIFAQRRSERQFKLQNYEEKARSLVANIQRLTGDIQAYNDRLRGAEQLEAMRRDLQSTGNGSRINTLAAQDNRMEITRQRDASMAQQQQGIQDLQALNSERDGYVKSEQAKVGQDLADSSRKLSDAREDLNKASLHKQLIEMRADQDAVVNTIAPVSVGSVLQSGDKLFTLVPLNAPLETEVNIPGSEAGFVRPGDTAVIKFDTFSYTTYGSAEGHVRTVSADSFTSNPDQQPLRVNQGGTQQQGASFFRARVTLDAVRLHDVPASFRANVGMPVTVDIKVGERTIMEYLMRSVLPPVREGMREP